MDTARAQWELENDVEAASESDEASLFRYDEAQQKKIQEEKPWKQNPNYFKHVRVSALALIKMTMHCRSGGELEVMGMLQAVRERVIAGRPENVIFSPPPPLCFYLRPSSAQKFQHDGFVALERWLSLSDLIDSLTNGRLILSGAYYHVKIDTCE